MLLGRSLFARATVAALSLLAASSTTRAADRFVSTVGSDAANDCLTGAAPCRTVGHVLTQVASGDTVKIAEGTYTEDTLNIGDTTLVVSGGWTLDFGSQDPRSKTTIKAPHILVFYIFTIAAARSPSTSATETSTPRSSTPASAGTGPTRAAERCSWKPATRRAR